MGSDLSTELARTAGNIIVIEALRGWTFEEKSVLALLLPMFHRFMRGETMGSQIETALRANAEDLPVAENAEESANTKDGEE